LLTISEGSHVDAVVPLFIATRVDILELVLLETSSRPVLNEGAPFTTWQFVLEVQLARIEGFHGAGAGVLDALGTMAKV
jgi:hypothetical protein